jgi:hypothetical protein
MFIFVYTFYVKKALILEIHAKIFIIKSQIVHNNYNYRILYSISIIIEKYSK